VLLQPSPLIGQEIRFLRGERELKAKDFATLLNIDPVTLSRWEHNQQQPSTQSDAFIRTIYVVLFNEQMHQLFPDSLIKTLGLSSSDLVSKDKPIIIINTMDFSYSYQHHIPSSEAALAY
jgi:transcriptional regulator with XRE-family HTH domain